MKHKHNFHFVRIYYKSPFKELDDTQRYATFICSECGLLRELKVKLEEK